MCVTHGVALSSIYGVRQHVSPVGTHADGDRQAHRHAAPLPAALHHLLYYC